MVFNVNMFAPLLTQGFQLKHFFPSVYIHYSLCVFVVINTFQKLL